MSGYDPTYDPMNRLMYRQPSQQPSYGWGNALAQILGAVMQRNTDRGLYKDAAAYDDKLNNLDLGGQTHYQDQGGAINPNSNYIGKQSLLQDAGLLGGTPSQLMGQVAPNANVPTSANVGQGLLGGMTQRQQPIAQPQQQFFAMPQYQSGTNIPGMTQQGNIDIANRPTLKNSDGSISTVRSMGVNVDGKEVLLPTVGPKGENWTQQQAIDYFKQTGQNLGTFDTPQSSDQYAQSLHEQQAKDYVGKTPQNANDLMGQYSKANNPVQETVSTPKTLQEQIKIIKAQMAPAMRDLVGKYGRENAKELLGHLQQVTNDKIAEQTTTYNNQAVQGLITTFNDPKTSNNQKMWLAAQAKKLYGVDIGSEFKNFNASPDTILKESGLNNRWGTTSANNVNDNNTRITTTGMNNDTSIKVGAGHDYATLNRPTGGGGGKTAVSKYLVSPQYLKDQAINQDLYEKKMRGEPIFPSDEAKAMQSVQRLKLAQGGYDVPIPADENQD